MGSGGTVESAAPVRQITIGVPRVEIKDGLAIQKCNISLGNVSKEVYFSVEEKYGEYLCYERGDAYLIGLLNLAMRERCNIHSEVPFTAELVHQVQTELIPALCKYSKTLFSPSITGTLTNAPLPSAQKIATGCSCGIDSLHSIKKLTETREGIFKPDYLVINNVGAYSYMGETSTTRYDSNVENAKLFAKEYGAPLIITNSNFANVFPQEHLRTHLYSSSFAIYMLRKLWSRYYYASSGYDLESAFGLSSNESYDCAKYDLIALPAFSIPQLRICNEGNHASRYEKTAYLADDSLAQQYLNVCLRQGAGNCGLCPKCTRTLWALDALGKLDNFEKVLPVKTYKDNKSYYLRLLFQAHRNGTKMIGESYAILSKEMSLMIKCHAFLEGKYAGHAWWNILRRILKKVKQCLPMTKP